MNRFMRLVVLIILDAVLVHFSVWATLALRLDGQAIAPFWAAYVPVAPIVIAGTLVIAWASGLYASLWRYASTHELLRIAVVGVGSAAVLALATLVLPEYQLLPRSVPAIYLLLFTTLLGASRLSGRTLRRWQYIRPHLLLSPDRRTRVLVVGAGDAGVMVLGELAKSARVAVGFVDDDRGKLGMRIRGIKVLGTLEQVPELVRRLQVDEVLLAMPSAPARRLRELVETWRALPARLTTLPRLNDLINGRVTVNEIRPVALEDLLSRPPVHLDMKAIEELIRGRRVLVTGAGGSIGSELCRQISRFAPAVLVMVGHGENSLFETEQTLIEGNYQVRVELVIADVRDRAKVDQVFSRCRPEVVFHAAAHKHVPFMEDQPDEACKTNVFGTQNVALAALRWGCDRFVMISTDKAVNPTSVMGATKRVAEMVVGDLNGLGRTRFMSVRFGNVLGSRGSVVPLFQRQIARGGPVTVTDPDMKRYFMTIPEAVQLVLQAAAMGRGGEVFVLNMGEPVAIIDLARQLIILSGYEPERDIPIVVTGRRPGEKLFEETLTSEEGTDATHHERVYVARGRAPERERFRRLLAELEVATFGYAQDDRFAARMEVAVAADDGVNGSGADDRSADDRSADERSERILSTLEQLVPTYTSERRRAVRRGANGA